MFASGALAACSGMGVSSRQLERIGVQLYTLRNAMAVDAAATLRAVAGAGYREVETAGTGNLTPVEFAGALSDVGLVAPAARVPLNMMRDDPDSLLALAETVGHKYLVLPWIPEEVRTDEGYGKLIELLNQFGETCAREGLQLCYHNHDFEFATINGQVAFDRMLSGCDRSLVKFELDFYWMAHAGVDTTAYLTRDPGRFPLCHVKDRAEDGSMVPVGSGVIDFAALFAAGSGMQHYFVEHDHPKDSLTSILSSMVTLRDLRF